MEEAEIEFTPEALRAVAERAHEKDTGARGLRSVVEDVMLDVMYELPDQPRGANYLITEDVISGRERLFPLPERKPKSA